MQSCCGKGACILSHFSHVQLLVTIWTIALQALLSKGFSKQEYWSGLPCPLGDLPDTGIEPVSLTSTALIGRFFTTSASTPIIFLSAQSMEFFQRKGER